MKVKEIILHAVIIMIIGFVVLPILSIDEMPIMIKCGIIVLIFGYNFILTKRGASIFNVTIEWSEVLPIGYYSIFFLIGIITKIYNMEFFPIIVIPGVCTMLCGAGIINEWLNENHENDESDDRSFLKKLMDGIVHTFSPIKYIGMEKVPFIVLWLHLCVFIYIMIYFAIKSLGIDLYIYNSQYK